VAPVVDIREEAADLYAAIRERLVANERIDGPRLCPPDNGSAPATGSPTVATTATSVSLNCDTWPVTAVGQRGQLAIAPPPPG
jgi:hypothetical protein